MYIVGLTGSVGMGKSYAAARLRELKVPVFDADAAVHALLAAPEVIAAIGKAFPSVVGEKGIDRAALGRAVFHDAGKKKRLEAILHPRVAKEKQRFLARARAAGEKLVVLDIPLLFETGWHRKCDAVIVVRAPLYVQRRRVLAREGMSEARFQAILANQMPSREKERQADFVINTGLPRRKVVEQLKAALAAIRGGR